MHDVILSPLLAGLSVGISCFTYCIPFIAPYLVSEDRPARANVILLIKFLVGRLVGYVLFGAAVGYLGEHLKSDALHLPIIISMMLLSVLMLLHALGFVHTERYRLCFKRKSWNTSCPWLMGFLMGINICPPFLMSIAYVFTLQSVWRGIIYFLLFFVGTSVYLLPVFFLSFLGRRKEFQLAGRISAVVVGTLFLLYSLFGLMRSMPGVPFFNHAETISWMSR